MKNLVDILGAIPCVAHAPPVADLGKPTVTSVPEPYRPALCILSKGLLSPTLLDPGHVHSGYHLVVAGMRCGKLHAMANVEVTS